MKPKILLIGGNGFIGSHLVDLLLLSGYDVRVLDAMRERFRLPLPAVEYFIGDLTDRVLLRSALAGCDVLIHLAHNSLPLAPSQQPEQSVHCNVELFCGVLEQALHCQVPEVVFFSSGGAVYGETPVHAIREATECQPLSPYGRAKLLMEQTLASFQATRGLRYIVMRPSNPFGPRQDFRGQQGVIPIFLHRLMTGQPISIWGDGLAVKDYLYVSDLAEATLALMRAGFDNEAYNVGSGYGTSLRSILALLEVETGRRAIVEYAAPRATDVRNNVLAIEKLKARTGWQPCVSLERGIGLTRQWYEENAGAR